MAPIGKRPPKLRSQYSRLAYSARDLASFASYSDALFSQNEVVAGLKRLGELRKKLLNVVKVDTNERERNRGSGKSF
jgi:hypothetical protein